VLKYGMIRTTIVLLLITLNAQPLEVTIDPYADI